MLFRLLLAIAFVVIAVTIVRTIRRQPPAKRRRTWWTLGLGTLAVALVLMAATGRIHPVGALLGAILPVAQRMLPLLIKFFPLLNHWRKQQQSKRGPSLGNQSEVRTAMLHMRLDHDTQALSGSVLQGAYAGRELDSLSLSELQSLLSECRRADTESVKLLITYLNHRFGADWQQQAEQEAPGGPPAGDGSMSRSEAFAMLGLSEDADREAIIKAHRKLIQKLHPDRGGNDYLAAKINQAKTVLLG